MCIGNRNGGDDAIGPYISDKLKAFENKDLVVIDCDILPENYTSVVKKYKPKTLIIVDAVEMGLKPSEIRIIPASKIGTMHVSTHGIPLSVLMKYLNEFVEKIILVGVQPREMYGKLTPPVKKSGDKLVEIIRNKELDEIKTLE